MSDKDTTIKKIALTKLGLKTVTTQRSDSKDFHELAIWNIKSALEEAYDAGRRSVIERFDK